jgi:hypothetical protein
MAGRAGRLVPSHSSLSVCLAVEVVGNVLSRRIDAWMTQVVQEVEYLLP